MDNAIPPISPDQAPSGLPQAGPTAPPLKQRPQQAEAAGGKLPVILLESTRVHAVTELQAIAYILDELDAGHGGWVVTPNLDHMRRFAADAEFRRVYDDASLVLADGMPLVWASRLQGTPLPQRVAGSSLVSTLSAAAAGAALPSSSAAIRPTGPSPGRCSRRSSMRRPRP